MTIRRIGPPDWSSFTPALVQNEDVLEQITPLIEKFDRGTVRIEDVITKVTTYLQSLLRIFFLMDDLERGKVQNFIFLENIMGIFFF